MPWICVTLSAPPPEASRLATDLAAAVAESAGLAPADVIAIITVGGASAGRGAVATVTGRRRTEPVEAGMVAAVRGVVAAATGVDRDLVAVVRTHSAD